MSTTYSVEIIESSKVLSAKERIMFKDLSDTIALDAATQETDYIVIEPEDYAILHVHNSNLDTPDYEKYVVIDKNGQRYSTGSNSFWNSFMDIYTEMRDETDEKWAVKVYRRKSKNRAGKDFITCSLI